jgi:type IV pilus assembly protein PilM
MAKPTAVWGIDIGQSALKALRCVPGPEKDTIVADAFDFIEYGKILSQPDANPVELVRDAVAQFLSRNKIKNDKVVISVPGQSGLARFIKLPPVEASKIPDIVRYEAKQQIPFPLDEVVWDYQQISGGAAEDFALESEVGLFAMKRDQVYKAMEPFTNVNIEIDTIQLTPLALFNFVLFDQMQDLPPDDMYDPDNPPESTVVMSMGTESTDLVVTNGFKVWQRSIPIGGSHFTKAIVKDLKLNFATAEHLKRNSSNAEDPKALFQAMRPVFGDLLTEMQRSLGYFKNNVDRSATIGKVVVLGNVMKLPGLQKYLGQNLGYEVVPLNRFRGLTGPGVVDAPAFKENVLAFGVCYGLALQGLGQSKLRTSLVPKEILQDRLIRAKKPWAAAAAALLMLGLGLNYFRWFQVRESGTLDPKADKAISFTQAVAGADNIVKQQKTLREQFDAAKGKFNKTDEVGQSLLQNVASRDHWLELMRTVSLCMPVEKTLGRTADTVGKRNELKIDTMYSAWVDDLAAWQERTNKYRFRKGDPKAPGAPMPPAGDAAAAPPPGDPNANPPPGEGQPAEGQPAEGQAPREVKLQGSGWVIHLRGHHYHNDPRLFPNANDRGSPFVVRTLLANLLKEKVEVPPEAGGGEVDLKKVGIFLPVFSQEPLPLVNMNFQRPGGLGEYDPSRNPQGISIPQPRLDFEIMFAWVPGGLTAPSAAPPIEGQPVAQNQ